MAMSPDSVVSSFSGPQIFGRCILNVASPFFGVSDDATDGAEQVIARLDHAIVESGGKSLVIACENSRVSGMLIPVSTARGRLTPEIQDRIWTEVRENMERTLYAEPVDLIHFHGGDFHRYFPETVVPKLITLHRAPNSYPKEVFSTALRKNAFLHCVSPEQHRDCPNSEVLLSPISDEMFVPQYLRRYEIIIRGCNAHAGAMCS
jgi:hypothetical protein